MVLKIKIFLILLLFLNMRSFVFAEEQKQVIIATINGLPITLDELNKAIEKSYKESNKRYIAEDSRMHSLSILLWFGGTFPLKVVLDDLVKADEAYKLSLEKGEMILWEKPVTTIENKKEFLEFQMINDILLYQEALKRGLDKKEDVKGLLLNKTDEEKQDILKEELLKQGTADISVTDEAKKLYNEFKFFFKRPIERHIREIVVPTEVEATDIYVQLLKGADFSQLARTHSIAPSAANGGDLGFVEKRTLVSIFDGCPPTCCPPKHFERIFSLIEKEREHKTEFDAIVSSGILSVGDLSSIFKSSQGYCILKLEADKGGEQIPFEEMQRVLEKAALDRAKGTKWIELTNELRAVAQIKVYDDKIQ